MARWLIAVVALSLCAGCRASRVGDHGTRCAYDVEHALAPEPHDGLAHAHEHHEVRPPPLCVDLRRGWCACVDHAHESRRGTPYVHAFHVEPAFLGRDVLVHVEKEGDEHAVEVELEYALTRRLLLVGELPYRWTDVEDGVGDVGLGLRGLLVETDRFLLSTQLGFEWPTARGDLGADETVVAPSLVTWSDLGCDVTAQAGAGLEFGTRSGERELTWGASLAKSFECRALFPRCDADHDHRDFLTLFVEGRGAYPLTGDDRGTSSHEGLFGVSVPVSGRLEVRTGFTLQWDDDDSAESGWIFGFVVHL